MHQNVGLINNVRHATKTDEFDFELMKATVTLLDTDIFMQYTGLKDRQGVEIYEGDVVRNGDFIASIELGWSTDDEYGWLVCTKDTKYLITRADKHDKSYEVIGNIYSNPELLENESKEL
jgi:uncharacterized phage protein (TIGR01671 family)